MTIFAARAGGEVLADRIAGKDKFVGWEEPLHARVSYANLGGLILEQFVRHSGKTVLLLQQDRYAHLSSHPHGGTGGITADTYSHLRLELANNPLHLDERTQQIP